MNLDNNVVTITYTTLLSTLTPDMINCSNILIGPVQADSTSALPLTGPATIVMPNTVTCRLGARLQVSIKTSPNFGSDNTDTFAFFRAGHGILDGGNMVYMDVANGISAMNVIQDVTGPELMSFVEFDLDQGIISFSFNEVVNVSALNFTDLTLRNNFVFSSSTPSVTLTGGECSAGVNCTISDMFSFSISNEDLNRIKLEPDLCTSVTDCVPTYTSAFVSDILGLAVVPYDENRPVEHQLVAFIPDTTAPQLQGFDLNLSSDEIVLDFNEPVSVSTFSPTGFTLQATSTGGSMVTLTANSAPLMPDSETITVTLEGDADALKLADFATSINDTFLSVSAGAIQDLYTNGLEAINSSNAQQVRRYTIDTARPTISSVTLNLDTNRLVVTFSEPVLGSSIVVENFTLTNGTDDNRIQLSDSTLVDSFGNPLQGAATVISFMLGDRSLTSIKTDATIGSDTNTFLEWTAASFEDTNNNTNDVTANLSVLAVIPDNSAATLRDFSLDLNTGVIELTFTDVIAVSSARLDRRTVTLQNSMNARFFYDLSGGVIISGDSTIVPIQLSEDDIQGIKANLNIAAFALNTFVAIEAEAFLDLQGRPIVAVTDRNAIGVTNYIGDMTSPELESFDFDLNQGQIIMTFNEPVDNASLVFNLITVRESFASNSTGITLQGGVTTTSNIMTTVTLTLDRRDLNIIKADTRIATEESNTYLRLDFGAVNDTSRNPINSTENSTHSALPVRVFIPDTTPPAIERFVLNLNTGEILITFDETINITTFTSTHLILQSSTAADVTVRTISGGTFTSTANAEITLRLLDPDLNFIKLASNFGDDRINTYLRNLAGIAVDQSGNVAMISSPITAANVIPDTTPPDLQRYSLDLSRDLLSLTFNEPVNASTFNIMQFTLYRTNTLFGSVPLSGSLVLTNGLVIDVTLDTTLAFAIKNDSTIANDVGDTFIAYSLGAVQDLAGVEILERVAGLQASIVLSDMSGPLVDSFDLNLDQGLLTFYYLEPVDPASFDGRFVTIQDFPSSNNSVTLTGGFSVDIVPTSSLRIQLIPQDLNAVKANVDLATSISNTYLSFDSRALMDTFGNPVLPVLSENAIRVNNYTQDMTPPNITTFDLRNADNGFDLVLVVVFSETINASTVIPTSFTLLESPGSSNFYTLSGGIVALVNSDEISIYVNSVDLDAIKSRFPLGVQGNSSFLSATANSGIDVVGLGALGVTPAQAVPARNISADLIPPSLENFSLDMDDGVLSLTFDENVVPSTFNSSLILLQSSFNSNAVNLTLSSSELVTNTTSQILNIQLSSTDLDAIKVETSLGTDVRNTYISFVAGIVQDRARNSAFRIGTDNARQAANLILDTTRPNLIAFDLDMNTATLRLEFDEAVDHQTFDQNQIEIQSGMGESTLYRLRDIPSPLTSDNGPVVTVQLRRDDLAEIQRITNLAVSNITTYLVILNFAIRDMNGNFVIRIPNIAALPVGNYTADSSPPALESFTIDLDGGYLYLTFTEGIDLTSLTPSLFTLQSANSSAMFNHNLTSTESRFNGNFYTLRLSLSETDNNTIKSEIDFCTTVENCYISILPGAILNFVSLSIEELSTESALMAANVFPDISSPNLVEFVEFNLQKGYITLRFDEPVRADTFLPTSVILQTLFAQPLSRLSLTNATSNSASGAIVTFNLTGTEIDSIKLDTFVCSRRYTCYIRLLTGAIQDNSLMSNPVNEVLEIFPGFIATSFILDIDNPFLETYTLDLDEGVIQLTFNEPVSYQSIRPHYLAIQSLMDSSNGLNVQTYRLTGGQAMAPNGITITIALSETDFCAIKGNEELATNMSNTYIFFNDSFVMDLAHEPSPVRPVLTTAAVQAEEVVEDTTAPRLSEFQLDLFLDRLLLTYNEPVRPSSLTDLSLFTIESGEMPVSLENMTLSGGQVVTTENGAKVIMVMLLESDITVIKQNQRLATDQTNTFLTIQPGAIIDTAGIPSNASVRVQATRFVPDSTRPQLVSLSLDMNTGVLGLTYDDAVNVSTFDPTAFRIQNGLRATQSRHYTLTTSNTTSPIGYNITVQFSDVDFLGIKDIAGLARDLETSWLTMQAFAIDDVEGVDVLAITDGKAKQVDFYTVDDEPPLLLSFLLDLNEGMLNLTFSDFMDADSLRTGDISLQNESLVTSSTSVLNLSGGATTRSVDGRSLSIMMLSSDLNALKADMNFGTSVNDTFLTIEVGGALDLFGNPLNPGYNNTNALRASEVIEDLMPIRLVSFNFDLNAGILELNFDETYLEDSFSVDNITFQGALNATARTDSFTLTGADNIVFTNRTAITVSLSGDDLNAIKSRRLVASRRRNTYLSVEMMLVFDVSMNPTLTIFEDEGQRVSVFTPDIMPPRLLNYTVDLSVGAIIFTFSEIVDSVRFNLSEIQFQDMATNPTLTLNLSEMNIMADFTSPIIRIVLTSDELNRIKSVRNLVTDVSDTFISFPRTFTYDMAGIMIEAQSGFQVAEFIRDFIPPELLMYSLDVNRGVLILNFSEIVDANTFNLSSFVLQNAANSDTVTVRLPLVNTVVTENAANYELPLAIEDLNALKINTNLATERNNTFLFFSNGSVSDMLGNPIIGLANGRPPVVYIADNTGPEVLNFTLDFGRGVIRLEWSEPVVISTFLVTSFTLQNISRALTPESATSFSLSLDSVAGGQMVM